MSWNTIFIRLLAAAVELEYLPTFYEFETCLADVLEWTRTTRYSIESPVGSNFLTVANRRPGVMLDSIYAIEYVQMLNAELHTPLLRLSLN